MQPNRKCIITNNAHCTSAYWLHAYDTVCSLGSLDSMGWSIGQHHRLFSHQYVMYACYLANTINPVLSLMIWVVEGIGLTEREGIGNGIKTSCILKRFGVLLLILSEVHKQQVVFVYFKVFWLFSFSSHFLLSVYQLWVPTLPIAFVCV